MAAFNRVRVQGSEIGLLQAMDQVDFSGNCPHGRPAFLVLSRGDLERWFKRT